MGRCAQAVAGVFVAQAAVPGRAGQALERVVGVGDGGALRECRGNVVEVRKQLSGSGW